MSNTTTRAAFALIAILVMPLPARGDGGTVRYAGRAGGYQLTVFTAPTPLRAGPVDVSVLVQDADTGEPVPRAVVALHVTTPSHAQFQLRATREAATNKMFHSAQFDLPSPGRWRVAVRVEGARGRAEVDLELEAGKPPPPWSELWPWIAMPVVPVAAFALRVALVRRAS